MNTITLVYYSSTCAIQIRRHKSLKNCTPLFVGSFNLLARVINLFYWSYHTNRELRRDFKYLGLSSIVSFYYTRKGRAERSLTEGECYTTAGIGAGTQHLDWSVGNMLA